MFTVPSEAWKHGPVYKDIYDCFSYYRGDIIDFNEIVKDYAFNLTIDEKKLIDSVLNSFGCFSGSCLLEMTHLTKPWIIAREGLSLDDSSNRLIEDKDFKEYFKIVCDEFKIKDFSDISKYAEALYLEVKKNN